MYFTTLFFPIHNRRLVLNSGNPLFLLPKALGATPFTYRRRLQGRFEAINMKPSIAVVADKNLILVARVFADDACLAVQTLPGAALHVVGHDLSPTQTMKVR